MWGSGIASCADRDDAGKRTWLLHAQRLSGKSVLAHRRPVKRRPAAVLTRRRRDRIVMSCAWARMGRRRAGPERRERPPRLHRLRVTITSPLRETRTASARAKPRRVRYRSLPQAPSPLRGPARPTTRGAHARPDPLVAPVGCRTSSHSRGRPPRRVAMALAIRQRRGIPLGPSGALDEPPERHAISLVRWAT
jgi:hypothetical protein